MLILLILKGVFYMRKIKVVIMAGGIGERFWPKSRKSLPKQFLNIVGENTMIEDTVNRLFPLVSLEDIYISTGERYAELVKELLPHLPHENIIVEPFGKNTAACIGLAAIHIEKNTPDAMMVVLPSDHIINNENAFIETLKQAISNASHDNYITTIGIVPTHPETGYGYIKTHSETNNNNCKKVANFVEKPNYRTAKSYLDSGDYLWNSGMFIWSTSTFINNMKTFMPSHYELLKGIGLMIGTPNYYDTLIENYGKLESISVDYGILEKANDIYVIPGDFGWDDVGSWNAVERFNPLDAHKNSIKGNVTTLSTQNCTIDSNTQKLIVTIGLQDLIIVDTEDALLICSKEKTPDIKEALKLLKSENDNYL